MSLQTREGNHHLYLRRFCRCRSLATSHMAMDSVPGSVGTCASFALRLCQTIFSSASLFFMSLGVGFYSYTAFCFLVTVMGLVIPWSFFLALLDGYTILVKCSIHQSGILLIFIVVGDLVLSILTLAAASSSASIVDLLLRADESFCPQRLCSRYQISAAMAFLSWLLSLASSLFNLWLLPAL